MNITIDEETQRLLELQKAAGGYRSADEVIRAGLLSLQTHGDFAPGELDKLLAEGEADLARGDIEDGEAFFSRMEEASNRLRQERSR